MKVEQDIAAVDTVIFNTIKEEIEFVRTQLLTAKQTKALPPAGNKQAAFASATSTD